MGCGTARDLEYVISHVKACNTCVYLLDLSPALLEMAAKRVVEHGLADQVGEQVEQNNASTINQ